MPTNAMEFRKFAARGSFVGGSDARIVMGTDEAALLRLWQEKRGEIEPEDLSGNLIVQLGVATEPLNRLWYERNAGQAITNVQRRVIHPVNKWMAATLDGTVDGTGTSRFALSAPPFDGGKEILALRRERRAPSPLRHRATAGPHRGGADGRHELIKRLGRTLQRISAHTRCAPRA